MWYVIQVNTGDEENVLNMCTRVVNKETYNDLFIPRYVCSRRYLGDWHNDALVMFPGYLFVDTDDIDAFVLQLINVSGMTRVVGDGEIPVPVSMREQKYLSEMMDENHIIQISTGYLVGDTIEILSGPLKPFSAIVRKIDRHKRIAEIDVMMYGVAARAKVGLEIIKKSTE